MFVTFLIAFRESLEAFLLVGILLAYLDRLGARRRSIWIYLGAIAGLLASLVAAFVLQVLVDQFHDQTYRAILTATIMLIAVTILSYMALWMGKQAKEHTEGARRKLAEHVSAGRVIGIAALSFVSVLREGIETVLFLSALAYGGQAVSPLGGILGFVLAIVLVWALLRGARQVPLALFFRATSLLLIVIAAGLLGSAVNQVQGLGVDLGPTGALFDINWLLSDSSGLGTFLRGMLGYNATPTPAQFGAWALYLVVALGLWQQSGQVGKAAA